MLSLQFIPNLWGIVWSHLPLGDREPRTCHTRRNSKESDWPEGLWGNIGPRKKIFFLKTEWQMVGKWQILWPRCGTHLNSLNGGLLGQSRQSVVSHASPLLFSQVKSVWWLLYFLSPPWWTAWMVPGAIIARHSIGGPVRWLEKQGQGHDQRGKYDTLNGGLWWNPYI